MALGQGADDLRILHDALGVSEGWQCKGIGRSLPGPGAVYSGAIMAPPEPSTVWILGAGFSQGLNAPLFRDLFRSDHRIKAACNNYGPPTILQTLALYRRHAPSEVGGSGAENGLLWRDPEDFLDVLESASSGAPSPIELLQAAGINLMQAESLTDGARRALAIECLHFLKGADLATERWRPYVIWASNLSANDTVITFNYDRIPELLSQNPTRGRYADPKLEIIVPKGSSDEIEMSVGRARQMGVAPVLKLHGSVGWVPSSDGGGIRLAASPDELVDGPCPILGVPGPRKAGLRKEYKGLRVLWTYAQASIQQAERVVFVGYRFPPSDADARLSILGALESAATSLKKVEIVLGPDLNHRDVVRMRGLLSFAVAPEKVQVWPLYAEDFLPYGGRAGR